MTEDRARPRAWPTLTHRAVRLRRLDQRRLRQPQGVRPRSAHRLTRSIASGPPDGLRRTVGPRPDPRSHPSSPRRSSCARCIERAQIAARRAYHPQASRSGASRGVARRACITAAVIRPAELKTEQAATIIAPAAGRLETCRVTGVECTWASSDFESSSGRGTVADFYVDSKAAGGGSGSLANPWNSFGQWSNAAPGSRIIFRGGDYQGGGIYSAKNFTLKAYADEFVRFTNTGATGSLLTLEVWTDGFIDATEGGITFGPGNPNMPTDGAYWKGTLQLTGCSGLLLDGGPERLLQVRRQQRHRALPRRLPGRRPRRCARLPRRDRPELRDHRARDGRPRPLVRHGREGAARRPGRDPPGLRGAPPPAHARQPGPGLRRRRGGLHAVRLRGHRGAPVHGPRQLRGQQGLRLRRRRVRGVRGPRLRHRGLRGVGQRGRHRDGAQRRPAPGHQRHHPPRLRPRQLQHGQPGPAPIAHRAAARLRGRPAHRLHLRDRATPTSSSRCTTTRASTRAASSAPSSPTTPSACARTATARSSGSPVGMLLSPPAQTPRPSTATATTGPTAAPSSATTRARTGVAA